MLSVLVEVGANHEQSTIHCGLPKWPLQALWITSLFFTFFLPHPALAANSPVAVSADVTDSDPSIETSDFGGHKAWSIIWRRDAQGRELRIGFIENLQLPYREHPQELLDFAHDEDAGEAIAQTLDMPGRAEQLWNRNVFWLVMSEQAANAKDRRTCAVFTADPAPRVGTLVGAFCRDLAPGTKIDEATARQWLDDLDLRVP